MNELFNKKERERNNRCKLLQKVYAQKQKNSFNSMSFQIRVQNMIKQMSIVQNERSRCQSDCDQKFPFILRLNPYPKPINLAPLHFRSSSIRVSSRNSNIASEDNQQFNQQRVITKSQHRVTQISSSPIKRRNQCSIQSIISRETLPLRELKQEHQTMVELPFLENVSSWSRKSSESIL